MKRERSPLPADYTFHPAEGFPYRTLDRGAKEVGITPQRMSRLLRILEVPVHRCGYTILIDYLGIQRVKKAIRDGEVRPGRKKKSEVS